MAWLPITNLTTWEYDTAPPDPGPGHPHRQLWQKQTGGIRTVVRGTTTVEIYVKCRPVGSTKDTHGEINKTYWDGQV